MTPELDTRLFEPGRLNLLIGLGILILFLFVNMARAAAARRCSSARSRD